MLVRGRWTRWAITLLVVIALGITSRLLHTGLPLFDKYLGDALYAVMFFLIFRLRATPTNSAFLAMAVVTTLELFQLTAIPLHLSTNPSTPIRLLSRLLGTEFSFADLLAYAVGLLAARAAAAR